MKYYCSKCGAELMRGGKYCPSCGAHIIGVARTDDGESGAQQGKDTDAYYRVTQDDVPDSHRYDYVPGDDDDDYENHGGGGAVTILLGVLVAISAVIFVVIFLRSKSLFNSSSEGGQVVTAQQDQQNQQDTAQDPGNDASAQEAQAAAQEEAARKQAEEEERQRQEEEEAARKQADAEEKKKQEEEAARKKAEEEEKKQKEEEERKKTAASLGNGDYIISDSNSRYLSRSEAESLSDHDLILAINEIYARRGRKFAMAEFRDYFESKSWYNGTIEPEDFDKMGSDAFNEYENANRQLLIEVAEERGLR